MPRLKWIGFIALLGLTLVFDPEHSTAQFGKRDGGSPGGFGAPPGGGGFGRPGGFGGSGFKMDPEMAWSMMQRSMAGPTPDTIDLSKMDPRMRDFSRQRAEQSGGIPLPDSGIMTKAQYLDHFARSEAAKAAKAAAGSAPGGPPAPGGAPMVMTFGGNGPQPGAPMTFSVAPGGPPGGFGGPPPGGGEDRGAARLKEQDKDGDGRVSFAEADGRLRENFKLIDRSGDGFVDLEEYRGYYANRDRDRGNSGSTPGGFGSPGGFGGGNWGGGSWGDPNAWGNRDQKDPKKETQEPKPIAMRYGFLPKDLPEWFDKYDSDKDGQVALHEWRKAGDDIAKFQEMDLNADGLITADELQRFNLKQTEDAKIAALNGEAGSYPRPSFASGGRGPSGGGFSLPGSTPPSSSKPDATVNATNDKPSRGDKDKPGDKPNPFRDGGWGKKPKN